VTAVLVLGAIAAATLAFANGANDNPKPVATLVAAGLASPRRALLSGTLATLLGCVAAIVLGRALVASFSAKGLVGAEVVETLPFLVSAIAGAAATVLLATRLGLPVSTTHALIGAIVGAGAVLARVDLRLLVVVFLLPLLLSPFVALLTTAIAYPFAHRTRRALGVSRETCVCVGERLVPMTSVAAAEWRVTVGDARECRDRYTGRVAGVRAASVAAGLHWLSALALSGGRGVQDGAKIAGLTILLVGSPFRAPAAAGIALAMATGGLLAARRVEETMAHRVTPLNDGQALLANTIATVLVFAATAFGVPVSTTHVTTGSLMGMRAHRERPPTSWIGRILLAWLATLPLAALLAAGAALLLRA